MQKEPKIYRVPLDKECPDQFVGEGPTRKEARANAVRRVFALSERLRCAPYPIVCPAWSSVAVISFEPHLDADLYTAIGVLRESTCYLNRRVIFTVGADPNPVSVCRKAIRDAIEWIAMRDLSARTTQAELEQWAQWLHVNDNADSGTAVWDYDARPIIAEQAACVARCKLYAALEAKGLSHHLAHAIMGDAPHLTADDRALRAATIAELESEAA